jgi:hypothetical protein
VTSRWRGRLERRDLEGGTWVLVSRGEEWTLYGDIPDLRGAEVEVEGDEGGFGIGMAGPSIEVRRVRRLG